MDATSKGYELLDKIKKEIVNGSFIKAPTKVNDLVTIRKSMLSDIEKTMSIISDKFRYNIDEYIIDWEEHEFLADSFIKLVEDFLDLQGAIESEKEVYKPDYGQIAHNRQLEEQERKIAELAKVWVNF